MAKRIPLYPRIDLAKKAAKEFILKSKVKSLPVNPYAICKQHGFVIRSVSEVEGLIEEIDPFDVRYNTNCDAKTYLTSNGRYVIVYDDTVFSQGRIIWTIAHEIGHIVLKHLTHFAQTEIHNGLTDRENEVLEKEADAFASEFLAPAEVLLECRCIKKNMIKKLCGLSDEAATYREEYLKKYEADHKYQHLDQEIVKQFYNFIDSKDFFVNLHHKVCPVCKNYIFSTRERFCRICSTPTATGALTKGFVYNDGPVIDKQKKSIVCPTCFKSQGAKKGSNCIHCGTTLVNKCSNDDCEKTHASSSRYCYECGSPNVFLLRETVPEWEIAKKSYEEDIRIKHILENDKETGRIFGDWQYLLSFMKEQGEILNYSMLKKSIAKIDYDTLFIHSQSDILRDRVKNDESFSNYIIKLAKEKLNIPIMEVLYLEVNPDDTVSFEE